MNARELHDRLEYEHGAGLRWLFSSDSKERETILRALRLLADAERNDGTTKETDALVPFVFYASEDSVYDGEPLYTKGQFEHFERERNGLAARLAEYESTDLCGPGGPCKALASSYAALAERDAELARLRARLEIDFAVDGNGKRVPFPDGAPDGIACRDETIRLLENELEESARLHGMGASREAALQARLAESARKCERLKVHAEAMAVAWEKLDFDDGESEDAMEESVFDYRAEFKE